MASRLGLDRRTVVATAFGIVDREGLAALTMTRLADDLGIRLPSLYAHVRGQDDLRRELWFAAVTDLGDCLGQSVMGRSGEDALLAFATELRDYARRHPGRYQLTLDPPVPFDEEAAAVRRRANAPFRAVIRSFGLDGEDAVHAGRALRAAIHGFVGLEAQDALGDEGADESFRHLIGWLTRGLRQTPIAV
ncbi:MAG TPA: WHG domain-containing protein [Mycobacteriales bacterium]|nr:WHG domain-containing protein [Mycobacteriales bacterium]